MENLIQQIQPMLEKLGELTKQGSMFTWELLVKQQYIEGVVYAVISFAMIGTIFGGYKLLKWATREDFTDEGGICFLAFIIILVGVGLFIGFSINSIYHLLNPEYQAIKNIFELVNRS